MKISCVLTFIDSTMLCHFSLSEYINTKLEAEEREPFDGLEEYITEDITVKHAVEAWKVACQKSEDYHSRMQ